MFKYEDLKTLMYTCGVNISISEELFKNALYDTLKKRKQHWVLKEPFNPSNSENYTLEEPEGMAALQTPLDKTKHVYEETTSRLYNAAYEAAHKELLEFIQTNSNDINKLTHYMFNPKKKARNNSIKLWNMCALIATSTITPEEKKEFIDALYLLDKDKDGYITRPEENAELLNNIANKLNYKNSMDEYDIDGLLSDAAKII
jgi:hypothetical protein